MTEPPTLAIRRRCHKCGAVLDYMARGFDPDKPGHLNRAKSGQDSYVTCAECRRIGRSRNAVNLADHNAERRKERDALDLFVATWMAEGDLTQAEMADILHVSVRTIKRSAKRIRETWPEFKQQ